MTVAADSGAMIDSNHYVTPSSWTLPSDLPVLPQEAAVRRFIAATLLRAGCIRVAERISRSLQWPRRSDSIRLWPERVYETRYAILCYHRIGSHGVPLFSGLPRAIFEQQMAYLRDHYRVISIDTLLKEKDSKTKHPPSVVVTFDDGYSDLYSEALPALRHCAIPATIYLTVGSIQSGEVAWYDRIFLAFQVATAEKLKTLLNLPNETKLESPKQRLVAAARYIFTLRDLPDAQRVSECKRLEVAIPLPPEPLKDRMLRWDQVQEMKRAGISFGTHTMTHPMLSKLTSPQELLHELNDSKQILEDHLQDSVSDFAYPFGTPDSFTGAVTDQLAQLGYRSATTMLEGSNVASTDPFALRRVTYCESTSLPIFAARLARLFLRPSMGNG